MNVRQRHAFLTGGGRNVLEIGIGSLIFLGVMGQSESMAQVGVPKWMDTSIAEVTEVCWSPDGTTLASTGFDGCVRLWDSETGAPGRVLPGSGYFSMTVAWSHKGDRLASGAWKEIRVWDPATGQRLVRADIGFGSVHSIKWSPDDSLLAFESYAYVYIINSSNGAIVDSIDLTSNNDSNIKAGLCWVRGGRGLIGGSVQGRLFLYDLAGRRVTRRVQLPNGRYGVYDVSRSPDGDRVTVSSYKFVYVVGTDSLTIIDSAEVLSEYLWTSAWRPGTNELVVGGNRSPVSVYDAGSMALTSRIRFPDALGSLVIRSLQWSPHGDALALCGGMIDFRGYITVWRWPAGTPTSVASLFENGPRSAVLFQNYPDPFNPTTTIRYELPERCDVLLEVFNTPGQRLAVLQNGEQEAGAHEVRFEAAGLPGGVYFYRLRAGTSIGTGKCILLR